MCIDDSKGSITQRCRLLLSYVDLRFFPPFLSGFPDLEVYMNIVFVAIFHGGKGQIRFVTDKFQKNVDCFAFPMNNPQGEVPKYIDVRILHLPFLTEFTMHVNDNNSHGMVATIEVGGIVYAAFNKILDATNWLELQLK